jgi:hypothetical protein
MRALIVEHRRVPLLATLSALVALGVAGCGSSTLFTTRSTAGRLPPIAQLTAADRQEIAYLGRANQVVFKHHKDCFPFRQGMHRTGDDGSPSQAMLSAFAVLKLPTKAAVPVNLAGGGQEVYVNYVRIAQTRFGWPFKVIPLAHFATESARCVALEASEVHTLIADASAKVRAKVDAIEHNLQLDDRYVQRHPEGICVSGYQGGSLCETLLYAIERGGVNPAASRASSSDTNPVSFDLVPNGVARITVRYPKQPGTPARTINVQVINNLAVWKVTDEPSGGAPTIVWRAAKGRTIRTIADGF